MLSNSHTYLYADNTSIFYQHKNITKIENTLNKEFANVFFYINFFLFFFFFDNTWDWFVDNNKLSIYFGEDKTKCTLFHRGKNLLELNITINNNWIKQYHMVQYLGFWLYAKLSGEFIAVESLRKINTKLQFFYYRQNEYQTPELCWFLFNSLIQTILTMLAFLGTL